MRRAEKTKTSTRPGRVPAGPPGAASRAVDRITPRAIQVTLGAIWLLDGALQLQPYMFSHHFLTDVLLPVADGQPAFVASLIRASDQLVAPHLAVWNGLFAALQVGLGVGLLVPRTVKPALVASFAWSALVWCVGEGFGGLLSGSATPLTGAPGAVLLYALVGILAWPTHRPAGASITSSGPVGDLGGRLAWALLWAGSGVLCLVPANWRHGAIASTLASGSAGEPAVLASLDRHAANLVAGQDLGVAIALAVLQLAVAAGVLGRWHRNVWVAAGAALAVVFWVLGQDLGGLLTGQTTDPNTGPLLVLLALCLVEAQPRAAHLPAASAAHAAGAQLANA